MPQDPQLDALIRAAGFGDRSALDLAFPGLYDNLHEIASAQMAKEKGGNLLQTTAIVHEAYVRLSKQNKSRWQDCSSFFAAAAVVMRRVLIDNARKEKAAKRGRNASRELLSDSRIAFEDSSLSAVDVHEALERLADFSPEQAHALELMIFGGMSGEEVAQAVGVSASTIDRRIRSAKAWLRRELSDDRDASF